jgi:hypothetical protein
MAREIGMVAETAERVGGRVRGLDEEQVRFFCPLIHSFSWNKLTEVR